MADLRFDEDTQILHHTCGGCETETGWHISNLRHYSILGGSSMALSTPPCPTCLADGQETTHHFNCDLPDDHPHPHRAVIHAVKQALGPPTKLGPHTT